MCGVGTARGRAASEGGQPTVYLGLVQHACHIERWRAVRVLGCQVQRRVAMRVAQVQKRLGCLGLEVQKQLDDLGVRGGRTGRMERSPALTVLQLQLDVVLIQQDVDEAYGVRRAQSERGAVRLEYGRAAGETCHMKNTTDGEHSQER